MRLIPNAGAVARRAFSMWMMYLGFLSLNAPDIIFLSTGIDTDPAIWSITGNVLFIAGVLGRLIDQGIDRPKDARFSPAIVGLIAMSVLFAPQPTEQTTDYSSNYSLAEFDAVVVPHVAQWEGENRCRDDPAMHCAYLDRIASPPVWTVCFGETKGVKSGDRYTDRKCREMLAREVREYREGLHAYFTPETKAQRLTAHRDAAYTSLAYNVGIAGAGKSTATRRLNEGDIRGGCEAIGWWNKAGGRVIRGLVNRRAEEVALCRRGLA